MTDQRIVVEYPGDRVAHVIMNRPEKLNAMDRKFFDELHGVMTDLDASPDIGAAIISGSGRAFSAGGDIASFPAVAETFETSSEHVDAVFRAFHAVESCSVPVVAAIHGIAHGGGLEITMACDMAIASTDATFAFREASLGLIPGFGITRAPEKIGLQWTIRLASTAEEIDASTALDIGLVMEVVPPEELISSAHRLASKIATNSRAAVMAIKRQTTRNSFDGIERAVDLTALTFQTDESREGIQKFLNRKR